MGCRWTPSFYFSTTLRLTILLFPPLEPKVRHGAAFALYLCYFMLHQGNREIQRYSQRKMHIQYNVYYTSKLQRVSTCYRSVWWLLWLFCVTEVLSNFIPRGACAYSMIIYSVSSHCRFGGAATFLWLLANFLPHLC